MPLFSPSQNRDREIEGKTQNRRIWRAWKHEEKKVFGPKLETIPEAPNEPGSSSASGNQPPPPTVDSEFFEELFPEPADTEEE